MLSRDGRWLAAAVQAIVAWEWLVSGVNKVLSGDFPQGLANTLTDGIQQNPNGWYVWLLQRIVVPNSVAFGYLIEASEVFIGLALFIGVVVLLGPVRGRGTPQHRLAVAEIAAAAVAALLCVFLCVNFHFFMGDGIIPWFDPGRPFDEGISLDTLMPPIALLLFFINAALLADMNGIPVGDYLRRGMRRLRGLFGGGEQGTPQVADTAAPLA